MMLIVLTVGPPSIYNIFERDIELLYYCCNTRIYVSFAVKDGDHQGNL